MKAQWWGDPRVGRAGLAETWGLERTTEGTLTKPQGKRQTWLRGCKHRPARDLSQLPLWRAELRNSIFNTSPRESEA